MRSWMFALMLFAPACFGQLDVETGSFRQFIGGVEPACAYDNWVSHISEGIARSGYNVYAPSALDPQTTGFGAFEVLQNDAHGQAVLSLFADLADSLMRNRGDGALARLQQEPDVAYELLIFQDTETGRSLFVLRELLDMAYTDLNNAGAADDVFGSFRHGWGIFVFNPMADRQRWVVEAPHPNDDYPSPYIATDIFLNHDAGILMINGAGREVAYTGNPNVYTNAASLSDPSRNCLTPFAVIHRRAVEYWREQGQLERTVQVHTYDNATHLDLKSAVLSGGRTRRLNFAPIYDSGGGPTGLLNNLLHPVHAANTFGFTHSSVSLVNYIATQSQNNIRVTGGTMQEYVLGISPDLWGFPGSCQEGDSHPAGYPDCHAGEDWIHVEMDELPTIAHTPGFSTWYQTSSGTPANWGNFSKSIQYFSPIYTALALAEDSLAANHPTAAPTDPTGLTLTEVASHAVALRWTPLWSTNFETYEILADPSGVITPDALVYTYEDLAELCWAPLDAVWVGDLDYQVTYAFALRGRDQEGRVSGYTNVVTGMPDDLVPPLFYSRFMTGQSRYWVPPGGGPVNVRIEDEDHQVDLSSLSYRMDLNNNGSYEGLGEDWIDAGVGGFSADTTVTVVLNVPGSGTGRRIEFRAHDDQHADIWGCSGTNDQCGISFDWRLGVDPDTPNAFNGLNVAALTAVGGITLNWPAQNADSTFYTYEVALAPFAFTDFALAPVRYTRSQISNLGARTLTNVTLPIQPWIGDSLWIRVRIQDAAGNLGASDDVAFLYFSPAWCTIQDLAIGVQLPVMNLSWSTAYTLPGLHATGWWLHRLSTPWEDPAEATRLLHTTVQGASLSMYGLLPSAWFRVVTECEYTPPLQVESMDEGRNPVPATRLNACVRPRLFLPATRDLPEDYR